MGDVFRSAKLNPTILLDNFCIPNNYCNAIAAIISQGTANVISNGSFCRELPISPPGTSAIIVAPSIDYN